MRILFGGARVRPGINVIIGLLQNLLPKMMAFLRMGLRFIMQNCFSLFSREKDAEKEEEEDVVDVGTCFKDSSKYLLYDIYISRCGYIIMTSYRWKIFNFTPFEFFFKKIDYTIPFYKRYNNIFITTNFYA